MFETQDRLRGIAVGAVVGDALGMPLEFQPQRPIYHLLTEMIRGALPAGTFTDDTEMALALAESLLSAHPLDPRDLVARFTGWSQSSPSDIGIYTKQVLGMIAGGKPWKEAARIAYEANPDNAGNGSLMRCWPVALACWNNPALLVAESRLQSEVTHQHPDCVNACVFVNLVLQSLVNRAGNVPTDAALRQAVANASNQVDFGEDFRLVVDLAPLRSRESLKNSGWVRHTVESSLWAVMTTRSFEEALVQAVNLGNDADTTGSVTGAIAGALYGLEAIPKRWKEAIHGEYPLKSGRLWFQKDFIELADVLVRLNE